jgi:hypothetical protein
VFTVVERTLSILPLFSRKKKLFYKLDVKCAFIIILEDIFGLIE